MKRSWDVEVGLQPLIIRSKGGLNCRGTKEVSERRRVCEFYALSFSSSRV